MDISNPLAPIFAASVALQQILEVLSVFVERWVGEQRKKAALGIIGFVIGIVLAYMFGLNLMEYFKTPDSAGALKALPYAGTFLDKVVTALVLSAGTEGTNSIVKFLKYLKEDKKATAAETLQLLRKQAGEATIPTAASAAERTLQKLRERAGMIAPSREPSEAERDPGRTGAFIYVSGR
ncbi:MAG TPA: hypothetical protein VL866_06835 [Pyrinomonadaceae bacterium]|nr:hypothetical protein [Pyrinomonadaceae bacterium]